MLGVLLESHSDFNRFGPYTFGGTYRWVGSASVEHISASAKKLASNHCLNPATTVYALLFHISEVYVLTMHNTGLQTYKNPVVARIEIQTNSTSYPVFQHPSAEEYRPPTISTSQTPMSLYYEFPD